MSGQISENAILSELCDFLARPVQDADRRRARLHLLDWIGCAVAAKQEPAAQILRGQSCHSSADRAFQWGGLGNILEMDDVDKQALLHPGPSIIPAALAVASAQSTSMEDLLSAIVVGYEATIRLGRAVGPAHYAMWHSTGTCGAIGAAAASATLLGLDCNQTAHALSLALSQSAGLWQTRHDPASMGKQLHTAVAARAGVNAAELAQGGFRGPLTVLEGEQGFFAAMCPDGDVSDIVKDAGANWHIHDVSFKPWPACRHAHAVIDAALELRAKVNVNSLEEIEVWTYADAIKFCHRPEPQSVIEAKFSLQHAVAIVLLKGAPRLTDFEPAAFQSTEVSELRRRVRVGIDEHLNQAYPARFGAKVICRDAEILVSDALGDPENPMTENQIREKAKTLMIAGRVEGPLSENIVSTVLTGGPSTQTLHDLMSEALA
ncbi:MAG: MmgE/PrpD family protein [Pseudomonadota bacterium]